MRIPRLRPNLAAARDEIDELRDLAGRRNEQIRCRDYRTRAAMDLHVAVGIIRPDGSVKLTCGECADSPPWPCETVQVLSGKFDSEIPS
ncbi:hypothetical protein SEA_LILBEANIE_59 [Gordonia phage Lilbeanie]|uniref:Uncharacterized protein n=1 Tax=Gordonia phage Lilbeanie TaxID=2794947 RepID=A0A7T1KSA7_9CAUD|nr:hypothetical protein J1773_gp59 [Gordonia phage Lilbeanie]QPO17137.1 hypothetical protein SEA_LILBEANIE_59 [Gordonia phage Lilbeanie]